MKPYLFALVLITGIGVAFAWRPGSAPARSAPDPQPPLAAAPPRLPPAPVSNARLSRNPFEYGETVSAAPRSRPAPKVPLPSLAPAQSATPLPRLVGFLRKGGALKAILAVRAEVLVLAVGEEGGGYTVIAADEERGARLRGPDRAEFDLTLPDSSGS